MSAHTEDRRQSIWSKLEYYYTTDSAKAKRNVHEYFVGPRDSTQHSKLPKAFRMHGSVTPRIFLRVFGVTIWTVVVTLLSQKVHKIDVHPIMLTILGITIVFSLNLRSSTAYERYTEGRKCWSQLNSVSTALARNVWTFAGEREGEQGKQDLLAKITFLKMIVAFSVALKHRLRFEPYIQYDDLYDLVSHLDTFAKQAGHPTAHEQGHSFLRRVGDLLHVAEANPRAELKKAKRSVGNLPLEILMYMSAYLKEVTDNGTMKVAALESKALNDLRTFDDVLAATDRILNTPMPIAYSIAIAQITWIYVLSLPIQLVHVMGWITIPVTTVAAYIIQGFAAIGNEFENPFGHAVNDLPLEMYCAQIASNINIIASKPPMGPNDYSMHPDNKPLYPISSASGDSWPDVDMSGIRDALNTRALLSKPAMWQRQGSTGRPVVNWWGGSVGESTLA
ncbi:UPF0187-domain-containing protein [Plenodomus tracheiphilus IPT5]|uniref:UPF0187-domain-containing protein n=1 Tax=Plenodomus tracheiphilus IPT5 TaxID=1408161 RepID=A0A6A7B0X6_9PLEO|nr:UPF0187-domain-containing protein [Plenodomus tracheiphilus IPT5]